jgi:hypothetical protein
MRRLWPLLLISTSLLSGSPASAVTCDGAFHVVSHAATAGSDLRGVTALSRNDVWAVGVQLDPTGAAGASLAEHWDGASWQAMPTPGAPGGTVLNVLNAVSGVATDDVWAVGISTSKVFVDKPLVEHWDGQAWHVVQSPSPNANGVLFGTVAISPTDAWAGGSYLPASGPPKALLLRWNGTRWRVVAAPAQGVETVLAMDATGSRDVWAVGRLEAEGGYYRPLVKHWDGTAWTDTKVPQLGTEGGYLRSVVAIAPDDAWAVGIRGARNVAMHWDGKSWTVVPAAHPSPVSDFSGVAATSSSDVWAVGAYLDPSLDRIMPLAEHWNGTGWTVVHADAASGKDNRLSAVAAVGQRRFAVGNALKGRDELATIEHSCGAVPI